MSTHEPDDKLIDRHLAGMLEPDEEARLERLIRRSPEWARAYREAEELARLLGDALGPGEVPPRVLRALDHLTPNAPARPAYGRTWDSRRLAAVAAAALVLLAVYVLLPGRSGEIVSIAYSAEPMALKDLARTAQVGVVGHVVQRGGELGFSVDQTLFGSADTGLALPKDLRPGQRVVLFGVPDATGIVRVLEGGVIHLDGLQAWEGRALEPQETLARCEQATDFRSLARTLADLDAFMEAAQSRFQQDADGLRQTGAITARYLGRFEPEHTREALFRLVTDADKHLDARHAGSEALVEASPVDACRRLLDHMIAGRADRLRAESEDGFLLLGCLRLIQRHGGDALGDDLERLADLFECPALRITASDAAQAVRGRSSRTPRALPVLEPLRLERDGAEALVLSGCEGRRDGLVVVFRDGQTIKDLRMAINLAVGEGLGVLVMPAGCAEIAPWLELAVGTGRVVAQHVQYLGIEEGARRALEAAGRVPPASLSLYGDELVDLAEQADPSGPTVRLFSRRIEAERRVGAWSLFPASEDLSAWLHSPVAIRRMLARP